MLPYADEGVSGTIPFEKRPEGKQLLEDARAGKFNTVVFLESERIGRDVEPIHLARKLLVLLCQSRENLP